MRGLDGKWYGNDKKGLEEMWAADNRWRQQERQNKILNEQNKQAKENLRQQEQQNRLLEQQNNLMKNQMQEETQEDKYSWDPVIQELKRKHQETINKRKRN